MTCYVKICGLGKRMIIEKRKYDCGKNVRWRKCGLVISDGVLKI